MSRTAIPVLSQTRHANLPLARETTSMPKRNPTPDQHSSVPCPSCGVAAGQRCILHWDAKRPGPHVDRNLFAIEVIQKNGAVEARMPFFHVKCKNPSCDAIPVTPYYASHTKPEEIKSSMTGCGPIQITCAERGHIDTGFRDDFRVTRGG